jgi:hypothetical protein
MQPIVFDPHNHVPEVSSEDQWGDPDESPAAAKRSRQTTVLPPRRIPVDSSPSPTPFEGIRIEAATPRRIEKETTQSLEIQNFGEAIVRLDPEEPTQPRVPQQKVKPQPVVQKRLGAESPEWGRSRKLSVRWALGIGLGIPSIIVGSLMLLPLINRSNAVGYRPGQTELALDKTDALNDAGIIADLLNLQPDAELLFEKFMSASTAEDLATVVRNPLNTIPLIRANKRSVLISKRRSPSEGAEWNVPSAEGTPFGLLTGTLPDFSNFRAYFLVSEGQLRIDWKATTGYGSASFDELKANRGDPAEIRGSLRRAADHTAMFPESEFQSYVLTAPDGVNSIRCHSRRGGSVDKALEAVFLGGGVRGEPLESHRVTLRLEPTREAAPTGRWVIGGLLWSDWVGP